MRAVLMWFSIAPTLVAMVAAVASPFDDADSAFGGSNYGITTQHWFPKGVAEAQHRFLVEGQRRLATRHYLGQGAPQDYVEAAKWYQLAAEQGSSRAQYNLGIAFQEGRGVPKDYAEAAKWYRRAAEQGFDRAQYNLAVLYYFGQGVSTDYSEAVRWLSSAANQGLAAAQNNLGVLYENGQGVQQDLVRAYMWFSLSAAQGSVEAVRNANLLAQRMTPAQLDEGNTLVRGWKSTGQH